MFLGRGYPSGLPKKFFGRLLVFADLSAAPYPLIIGRALQSFKPRDDHAENPLPQRPLAAHFRASGLKERAAQLLHLVHQKGQQHQVHEDRAQMFLTQTVVVAEVIALVLEGLPSLVLGPPAGTTIPHDLHGIVRGDRQVGDPAEAVAGNHLRAPGIHLPVLEEVDPQLILAGLVEGHGVDEAKTVCFVCLGLSGRSRSVTSPRTAAASTWLNMES